MHTDLKFFTNEPERDLYSRFAAILKSNTQFFDILVGYFRSSGFFKMYESLKEVEKIRILVGLNVDRFTVKIIDRANTRTQFVALSGKESKEIISNEVEKEFETAETSENIEQGVRIFIDWLKSKKLEMRLYTQNPIHAKVYILRKNQEKVPDMFGSVITGSSNFSEAGLINNLEFNVELKDAPDVKFALTKFEELWEQSIDIRDTYIEAVEQKTWLKNDITPYQLYLKTLYEFFKEELNADKENFDTLLPEGYMRLQYQIDAVAQARQKLNAYNGVFISDVVGLGKTYICAMLANSFNRNAYKLIVCPPVLVDYWKSVFQEFGVSRYDVESLGKLFGDIKDRSYPIVIDAANGAASSYVGPLFSEWSGGVTFMANDPDGTNINKNVGVTHIETLAAKVRETGAALGIAYDGDTDRVLMCDGRGRVLDGDIMLWVIGRWLASRGELGAGVVATVMSNMVLEDLLAQEGIKVFRCPVGDRYVLDTMKREGARIGGEQSGHIIALDYANTGDGLCSGILFLKAVGELGEDVSTLVDRFDRYPQVLRNMKVKDKNAVMSSPLVDAAAKEAERLLAGKGRMLLRPSGTEPLIRIFAESRDAELMNRAADIMEEAIGKVVNAQ